MPTIIDFYADWCKPCKMIAPTLEKLQEKYKGKIRVYKINTDENPGLSQYFQIQGIPALLFIPMEGQPQMASGALPEADFEKAIKEAGFSSHEFFGKGLLEYNQKSNSIYAICIK